MVNVFTEQNKKKKAEKKIEDKMAKGCEIIFNFIVLNGVKYNIL